MEVGERGKLDIIQVLLRVEKKIIVGLWNVVESGWGGVARRCRAEGVWPTCSTWR
jgi:hypothetical protein